MPFSSSCVFRSSIKELLWGHILLCRCCFSRISSSRQISETPTLSVSEARFRRRTDSRFNAVIPPFWTIFCFYRCQIHMKLPLLLTRNTAIYGVLSRQWKLSVARLTYVFWGHRPSEPAFGVFCIIYSVARPLGVGCGVKVRIYQ